LGFVPISNHKNLLKTIAHFIVKGDQVWRTPAAWRLNWFVMVKFAEVLDILFHIALCFLGIGRIYRKRGHRGVIEALPDALRQMVYPCSLSMTAGRGLIPAFRIPVH
jgi:hypothetical protein